LTGISLGFTYVIVMLVDFLFGFRCSRACELIGLDFWEHQFDDGSWLVISETFSNYFNPNISEFR
jgi:ammonia channel protein AmtB